MEKKTYDFKKIGINETEIIKELFAGVFTIEPWNDDWSNQDNLIFICSNNRCYHRLHVSCLAWMVSKWCNPSIKYQKILDFQGKIPYLTKL